MKNLKYYLTILTVIFLSSLSQTLLAQDTELKVTKFQIKNGSELYITINGKEKKLADSATEAWIIDGGKKVVYAGRDGAGGYENEGQSLRIYEIKYDFTRKILSQYYLIDAVAEIKLPNNKTVLLVRMSDGGAGNSYISVVDPNRGEVFFRKLAEIINVKGNELTLGIFKNGDWDDDFENPTKEFKRENEMFLKSSKPKHYKTEKYNLNTILNKEVIFNENSFLQFEDDRKGLKQVKIYLWRVNDEFQNQSFVLSPVFRYVDPKAPLRPTLEALFGEVREDESEYGFGSTTFGMKFEGVVLKNGTALVKFSQPANQTNYGSLGPFIFLKSIEKTAMQFPAVKKVKICAIGETFIDSQLDKGFAKCPN